MRNLLLLASALLLAGCLEVQDLGGGTGEVLCDPDGDPCATGSDCCSGLCANGICGAAPTCAPDGDACSADADCCSQTCAGGVCSSGPICAPDGDACGVSADCCSQQCSNGVCGGGPVCAPDGDACSADADCCSQTCAGGVCSSGPMCAPDGDACNVNADCCSQQCSGGICSSGPMCAADGDACNVDADCCSQLCAGGVCAPQGPTYSTSFEGACPGGWTLTGDWQCGVPMNVGPPSAFAGTQCIGTQIAGNYSDLETWNGTTATSPDIDLTSLPNPVASFRMWIDTEGSSYDGANLQISTDGGATFAVLNNVMPAYTLTLNGQPAWGGHQQALGWQLFQADLSAFAGQVVRLRFAFRSDSSGTFPGVYIDDLLVN